METITEVGMYGLTEKDEVQLALYADIYYERRRASWEPRKPAADYAAPSSVIPELSDTMVADLLASETAEWPDREPPPAVKAVTALSGDAPAQIQGFGPIWNTTKFARIRPRTKRLL